ncbi:MAG: DNA translocase FtsK 4TM domain-containing protein, partial [Pseudomonadota bacterium]
MARLSGIQRLIEVGMIMSCGFSFFLLVALVTFDPSDPGWSQTGFESEIQNWMGSAGAYCADILLFGFGVSAYLVPFGLAVIGWYLFLHLRHPRDLDFLTISLRIIGLLLLVFGFTGLASINFDDVYNVSAGGAMGDIISNALIPYFSTVGSILLLLCFFCTGFTLTTGVSWLQIVDWVGEKTIWLAQSIMSLPAKLKGQRIEPPAHSLEDTTIELKEQPSLLPRKSSKKSAIKAAPTFSDISDETDLDNDLRAHIDDTGTKKTVAKTQRRVGKAHEDSVDLKVVTEPMPSFELLERADRKKNPVSPQELEQVSRLLESKLADFNIEASVVDVLPGPVITRFEMDLAPGVKVNKIVGLAKDLARAMSAISVRVVEVIPGKSVIGLELPNKDRE